MLEIVNYSMGICSAYIACRMRDEGAEPICSFHDTQREDVDTYRFGREVASRWMLNVIESSHGGDLWQWFADNKMIPARQISACSRIFKIIPGNRFLEGIETPGFVSFGYEVGEEDRAEDVVSHWTYTHLLPRFPLLEWNVTKEQCFGYFFQHGIRPPRMYEHFQHANCLPCKNFRLKDWIALAYHYPEIFEDARQFENRTSLRWMQDGPTLDEVLLLVPPHPPTRKGRHKLAMTTPAFDFTMGCDRCMLD